MANTHAMCSSFKTDLLNGLHAFGTTVARGDTTKDSFKAALFLASATINSTTAVYANTGELAGTGNYTQGGVAVTNANAPALTSTTAYWTPSASFAWTNLTSSGSFDAVLIYNSTSATKLAVSVHTFGAQSITAGNFSLTMPTNDSSTGLIRLA